MAMAMAMALAMALAMAMANRSNHIFRGVVFQPRCMGVDDRELRTLDLHARGFEI
jgi:hypothetical protein